MPEPAMLTSTSRGSAAAIAYGNPYAALPFEQAVRGHPHISPASGLHGQLGLYELEHEGQVRYLTKAEAEQAEAERERGELHPLAFFSIYSELLRDLMK